MINEDLATQVFTSLTNAWLLLGLFGGLGATVLLWRLEKQRKRLMEMRLSEAQQAVKKEPEKARPAWELAVVQMEGYFNRNLGQVKAIFWFAVLAMGAGFLVMMYGTTRAFQDPKQIGVAAVSAGAGVITQFIGATFMILFRSTVQESSGFMSILERINMVGMAVQILDTIPETEVKEKTVVRGEMVKILMQSVHDHVKAKDARPTKNVRANAAGRRS